MTTTEETTFAKTPGKQRRAYLARMFGSNDGSARGIKNPWDRERYQARIAFESAYGELWENDALRFAGTAADVEAAKTGSYHDRAAIEARHRRALSRPRLLHSGKMKLFLEPFGEHDAMPMDAYCDVGSARESPVTAMRATVPAARIEFVALQAGSPDGTAENVPAENRKWFKEALEYQTQAYAEDLEEICRHYGSPTGLPADIPPAQHAPAATYRRRQKARNESKCEFELELFRIDAAEAAANAPPITTAENWPPRIGPNRRALIDASFGDSPSGRRKAAACIKYETGVAALEEHVGRLLARDGDELGEMMGRAHDSFTEREAEYGEALTRPAILRANADKDLGNPFGVWWNWIHTYFDPADVTAEPVPMVAAVPEARARFVALVWGAKCETAEGVAAEDRAAYDEALELERQKQQQWLVDVCKHYGGSSPDEVPNEAKPAASLYWVVGQKMFALQCELELAVKRVDLEQQAARETAKMFG